jgi:hypothetical protein
MTPSSGRRWPTAPREEAPPHAGRTDRLLPGDAQVNDKGRPPWFSKRLALTSLLVSLRASGSTYEIVYVADGGVPVELQSLVEETGEVSQISGGSAAASLRRLFDLIERRAHGDRGLLWLAEDDYLYRRDAFRHLMVAQAGIPDASYFTLYTPDNSEWHAQHPSQPGRRGPADERQVGDLRWRRTYDTNSTFGIRPEVVASDLRLHRASTYAGAPFDHVALTLTSGLQPFSWRHLFSDLYPRPTARAVAGTVARPVARASLNLLHAFRGSSGARSWFAPVEDQATHVEQGHLSPHWDSQAYAEQLAAQTPGGAGPGGSM